MLNIKAMQKLSVIIAAIIIVVGANRK